MKFLGHRVSAESCGDFTPKKLFPAIFKHHLNEWQKDFNQMSLQSECFTTVFCHVDKIFLLIVQILLIEVCINH